MEVTGQLHALTTLTSKSPQYPLVKRLGRPQSGLDAVKKRKVSFLFHELNPDSLAVHSVA
jgi:hypothetical protein